MHGEIRRMIESNRDASALFRVADSDTSLRDAVLDVDVDTNIDIDIECMCIYSNIFRSLFLYIYI